MDEPLRLQEWIERNYEDWYRINRCYDVWAARHGVQENTLNILRELRAKEEGCTQTALCGRLALPKQTVSFALAKLERQGYLQREEGEDRRNKCVHLTPQGRQYAGRLLGELAAAEARAYGSLSPEDLRAVVQGMHALANALEQSLARPAP
jgi:DNA-binding MarR family transcriptional regulator